jgi:hypothetical protein
MLQEQSECMDPLLFIQKETLYDKKVLDVIRLDQRNRWMFYEI